MARASAVSTLPARSLELYDRLIATQPGWERKGAKMPYTSIHGNMSSFLDSNGQLCLRLPAGAREAFLAAWQTTLSVQHGTVLKEYVVVPQALFEDTETLLPTFAESCTYTASLKPKPTTRSK